MHGEQAQVTPLGSVPDRLHANHQSATLLLCAVNKRQASYRLEEGCCWL